MLTGGSFNAVVNLTNVRGDVEHLKRLALIFDKIYYIHPQLYCIEDMASIGPAGDFHIDHFFKDCVTYEIMTLPGLEEVLSIFEDAKIAKGISARDEDLKQLRQEIALIDHADPEFQKLTSNSAPGAVRLTISEMGGAGEGKQRDLVAISPSVAVWDSLILTNTLYLANKESLFPVFMEPRHRREMEYRYTQYKQVSERLAQVFPDLASPVSFAARFGEVAFAIFADVWPHKVMADRSPEQVIAYRNNMATARRKYVASLTELAAIAENNPWNQKTKDEVKKYLLKLESDLASYRQEAGIICQKMFDDLKGQSVELIMKAVGGGIAGAVTGTGLSGYLAPEISSWGLLLAGTLMSSARTIAQGYRTIRDCRRAQKEHKQGVVAYIAEFE